MNDHGSGRPMTVVRGDLTRTMLSVLLLAILIGTLAARPFRRKAARLHIPLEQSREDVP